MEASLNPISYTSIWDYRRNIEAAMVIVCHPRETFQQLVPLGIVVTVSQAYPRYTSFRVHILLSTLTPKKIDQVIKEQVHPHSATFSV